MIRYLPLFALAVATPAPASTFNLFGDPEPIHMECDIMGKCSFKKEGAYTGPMKGEPNCTPNWMTTPYNYVCKPEPPKLSPPVYATTPLLPWPGPSDFNPERPRPRDLDRGDSNPAVFGGSLFAGGGFSTGGSSTGGDFFEGDTIQIINASYVSHFTKTVIKERGPQGDPTPTPPPVPIPAAIPLLLSALGALALFRRRARA